MWQEITKDEYMQKVAGLKPIESVTDPDGVSPLGNGKPYIETVWGAITGVPIVKCEMRREHRHELEWCTTYFMFTHN